MLPAAPTAVDPALLQALVSRGQVYDLAQPIAPGMPVIGLHPSYQFTLVRRHGDEQRPDGSSSANELLVMCAHTGTHLDSLAHYGRNGKLHGGLDPAALQTSRGFRQLGVEEVPPIVQRGVLLDAAGVLGVDVLPITRGVDAELMAEAERRAGVTVGPDDVVLVRTGWARMWDDAGRFVDNEAGMPGVNESGAHWLIERGVRLVGDDTPFFELVPRRPGDENIHSLLIADHGVRLIENLNLERLAADGVGACLFVMLPLPLVGATGSPVRPIAIV